MSDPICAIQFLITMSSFLSEIICKEKLSNRFSLNKSMTEKKAFLLSLMVDDGDRETLSVSF